MAYRQYNSPFHKEGDFPEIKESHKGDFTAWAKQNGFRDACSAASAVLANKEKYENSKYDGRPVIPMAQYAENFGCSSK